MKHFLQHACAVFVTMLLLCNPAFAMLNGTYTIDASGSATATNYLSFASAVSDLMSGTRADGGSPNGAGVSGPVVFNVAAGTYNGQVVIGLVTGVSATNTITFDGGAGNAATRILQFDANSGATYKGVFVLNGSKYVKIRNLTITSTTPAPTGFSTPASFCVHFYGSSAGTSCDFNKLENCILNEPVTSGATSPLNVVAVALSGNVAFSNSAGFFLNDTITGNTINQGTAGVQATGTAGAAYGNVIQNNTFNNVFQSNIYCTTVQAIKIIGNYINSATSTNASSIGIRMVTCPASATDFTDVSGNTIIRVGGIGFMLVSGSGGASSTTLRTRFSNNFVGGGTGGANTGGMRISTSSNTDIWHNSINHNAANTALTNGGIMIDAASTSLDIRNNIFAFTGASSGGVPFASTGTNASNITTFSNNIFWNTANANLINLGGTLYTSANYLTISSSSWNTTPGYTSATNLHLTGSSAGKVGVAIAAVTTDIDGETRSAVSPLIGADDFPAAAPNDLSVASVVSPVNPITPGSQGITVSVLNAGSNTVTSGTIRYSINGGAVVSQSLSSILPLAAGASANFVITPSVNLVAGKTSLKVFTSLPNGAADSYVGNDTLSHSFFSLLCGNYTINGSLAASATNFVSFASAADGLNGGTVTCPVTFTIAAATYTEQITLTTIAGVSAVNTVTFDGVSAATRTLRYNGAAGSQHTIKLSGCKYVTFKNLTITGLSTTNAWPVHFASNNTNNNRFYQCNISVPTVNNDWNNCPVVFTSNIQYITNIGLGGINIANNEIDTCVITGGRGGINFNGIADSVNCAGNKFRGNTITNAYSWCISLQTAWGTKVLNNTLKANQSSGGGLFAYTLGSSPTDHTDISGNIITDFGKDASFGSNTFSGLYITNVRGAGPGGRFRVSNNIVANPLLTDVPCVMLGNATQVKDMDFVFNTLVQNRVCAQQTSAPVQWGTLGSGTANVVKNNIFAVTAASGSALPYYDTSPTYTTADFNNNIFYNTANSNAARISAATYTMANVVGGGGYNAASQAGGTSGTNPNFVSATDYHVTLQCIRGVTIAGVTRDIDNDVRVNPPTIGADEIPIVTLGAPTAPAGPVSRCQGSGTGVYTSSATNASSYTWSVTGGTNSVTGTTGTATVTWDASYSGTAVVSVTANNACGSSSPVTTNVTVNATPAVGINPSGVSTCLAGNTLTASGATTYSWSPATGLSATTGAAVTAAPTVATTYTVTGTSASLCTASATSVATPFAPLSGIYTIDNSVSGAANLYPNTTVFNSFATATAALSCAGISAAVTFNVAAGTYAEQVIIPAVPSSSAVKTITFDGGAGNASTRIIQAGNTPNYAIVRLNGASNIRLKNLRINSTVPSGTGNSYGIQLYGPDATKSCDNNIIQNCIVTFLTTTANSYGVVFSGYNVSPNPPTATFGFYKNNLVDSCTITNGATGIRAYGYDLNIDECTGNVFSNNVLTSNGGAQQLYLSYLGGVKVRNNTITSSGTSPVVYGIDLISCAASSNDFTEVSGNKVVQFNAYGIFLSGCAGGGPASRRTKVFNNMVGGTSTLASALNRCITIWSGSNHCDVWFNNCNANIATGTTGNAVAFYSDGTCTGLDVRNNIFACTAASGSGMAVYTAAGTGFIVFDYNILHNTAGSTVAFINGATYSATTVIGGGGYNANSQVAVPNYLSASDLHVSVQCIRGIQIPEVATDFDNDTRAVVPTIGADEIPPTLITPIIISPSSAVCLGLNNNLLASGSVSGYTWTPATGLSQTTGSAVVATTQGTPIVYTVTGSLANGCTTFGTVQVASTPTGGSVAPASSVVCSGGSKTFTVTGQFGSTQWQKSTDNLNWTDIAGATASTYNLTGITQTTFIRALAKTQICYDIASTSGVVTVSQTPVLSITQQTATSVTVSWTPSSSGDYTLTWSGAAGSGTQQTGSPFTIQSLTSGAALNLSVSKTSGSCAGTSAGTLSTYTLCAAPTAVAATQVAQGLKVTWSGSASAYRLSYRPLTMNAGWTTVDTTGTTKTIKPLYAGTAYAIRVQALDCPAAGQVGAASPTIFAYTAVAPTSCNPIPVILSATSSCPNQITVNLSGGPVWRVTLRRLSPTFSAGVNYQTSSAVTNFTLGSSGGSVWEVFATTVCGTSTYSQVSNVMTVTVKAPCEAPENIVVSHPTCNGFAVSWNPYQCSGGIPLTHYQVYLKRAGFNNWVSYNVGPDDGHHIFPYPSLVTNTLYSVYVRAFACNGAASVASSTQTISTASAGCRQEEQATEQTTAQAADGIWVMLYPNPTQGSFNVDVARGATGETNVKIDIVNAVGQVLQTDYANTAGNHDNFYVQPQEHIASGLYLVRVTVGESVFSQRLVVQKD